MIKQVLELCIDLWQTGDSKVQVAYQHDVTPRPALERVVVKEAVEEGAGGGHASGLRQEMKIITLVLI